MAFSLLKTSQVLLCLMILQASVGSALPQRRPEARRPSDRNSGFVRFTREDVAVPVTAAVVDDEIGAATEAPALDEMFIPLGEIPLEGELPASFDENFSDDDASVAGTEAPAGPDAVDEVVDDVAEDVAEEVAEEVVEEVAEVPVEDSAAEVEDAPGPVVQDAPAEEFDGADDAEALRINPAVAVAVAVAEEPEVAEVAEEFQVAQVADFAAAEEEPAPEEAPAVEQPDQDAALVQEDDVPEVQSASPAAPVEPVAAAPPAKSQQKPQKQTLYNVLPPLYGILYPLKPTGSPASKPGYAAAPATVRPLYPPPAAYRPVFPVTDEFDPPSPTYRPSKTVKPAADAPVTSYPKHAFGVPPTPRGLGFPTIHNTRDNLRFDVDWGEVGRRQRSAAAAAAAAAKSKA